MLDWSIPIKQKTHIQPVSPDLLAQQWCPKHSHTPQACHAMGELGATAHLFLLPFSWEAFNDQHLLRSRRPNASGRLNLGDVAPAKLPFAWNMMIVHEEIAWNSQIAYFQRDSHQNPPFYFRTESDHWEWRIPPISNQSAPVECSTEPLAWPICKV